VLAAVGEGDAELRAAAVLLLGRLQPAALGRHAAALAAHATSADEAVAKDAIIALASLSPDDLAPHAAEALLTSVRAASRAVQRVAILAPVPFDRTTLRTLVPDVPLCAPPLAPTPMLHATGTAPEGSFEAMLLGLGTEAVGLALWPLLPLRPWRTMAPLSATLHAVVAAHLRAPLLDIQEADVLGPFETIDWESASFIARLPNLRVLRVGGVVYDLELLRDHVDVRGCSVAVALVLGAVLGGKLRTATLEGGRVLEVAPLRARPARSLGLHQVLLGRADVELLRGVLSRNPRLEPFDTMALLQTRHRALGRTSVTGNAEAQALLMQAVQAVQGAVG